MKMDNKIKRKIENQIKKKNKKGKLKEIERKID